MADEWSLLVRVLKCSVFLSWSLRRVVFFVVWSSLRRVVVVCVVESSVVESSVVESSSSVVESSVVESVVESGDFVHSRAKAFP